MQGPSIFIDIKGQRESNIYIYLMKKIFALGVLFFSLNLFAEEKCGKVIFGDLDWDSSRFHVEVASFILKHAYGCEVDKIPGTTMPLLTALGKGDIHVLMEVWKSNLKDAWEKYEKLGEVKDLGVNFPDAVQGWYVPTYLIEGDRNRGIKPIAPNLKRVIDLPKYKTLFKDPEAPEKGRFYNCILGWSCEDVNTKKLQAYKLLDSFVNFRPGTGAALAAVIASKYQRGEPFVAYYWGPTWILGKYQLTMLEEPAFDPRIWDDLVSGRDLSKAVEYPIVKVNIGVNTKWSNKNLVATDFLKKYETSGSLTSDALAFMREAEGRTPRDAAIHFLRQKQDVWKNWLNEQDAEKVKLALGIQQNTKKKWTLDLGTSVNQSVNWVVKNYGDWFRTASAPILQLILLVERMLVFLPWWVFSLLIAAFSFGIGKKRLTLGVFCSLALIEALGLWGLAMQTLALMMISTFVSAIIGLPLGIMSSRSDRFRSLLLPVLDAMQTMPSFVYLIPALMLFGLGKVPAVFATVIYAIVPIIRLTDLGIRRVDPSVVEAATAFGANKTQLLLKVQLPLALPTIMAGINQTTMMALSMVVIASMIGARGLGENVLLGIQKLDIGQGFTAGLAIVLLAIVIDRITQGFGKKMDHSR
jgi:ABC-type proline/glycine betaine transport system permease subunit/ABC-type proline/glycine betaine transport system substrate-binding protein